MRFTHLDRIMSMVHKGWLSYPHPSGPGKEVAMSVLVLLRWEGDPDELLAAYTIESWSIP